MLIAPPTPAGTIAAFARISPSQAFSVDTTGSGVPEGHVVSQPRKPLLGAAVMFSEYATAVVGMPQELEGTGKEREVFPASDGGPESPDRTSDPTQAVARSTR
jgi:hypothetical protein